jgi:hypothetical protein
MIATGFVHGKNLNRAKPVPRSPFDHFGEGLRIPDPEIMPSPQRKEGHQHSGYFLFRVEIHGGSSELERE